MDKGRYSDNVRIVQIDTHFVETDAVNFRAVVQSLTGKDSSPVWPENGPSSSSSSSSLAAAAAVETAGGVETEAGKNYYYYDDNNDDARNFHHVAVKPGVDERSMMTSNNNEIIYEDGDDYILSFLKDLSSEDFNKFMSDQLALVKDHPLIML